jgi:hypothetical protein
MEKSKEDWIEFGSYTTSISTDIAVHVVREYYNRARDRVKNRPWS